MTDHEWTVVERPSAQDLHHAITRLASDEPAASAEAALQDALVVIGEACAEIADGKTPSTIVASLRAQGLLAEQADNFVDKAVEIVQAHRAPPASVVQGARNHSLQKMAAILPIAIAIAALAYILLR